MKFVALIVLGLKLIVTDAGEAHDAGHVEFRGVAAGSFDPQHWAKSSLHFVPDTRLPLLEPRERGNFRNIYAPSVVQVGDAWHVYYGGWDGEATGNDRIYRVDVARDFLTFSKRRTIIEHGEFQHVCNVSVIPQPPGRGRGRGRGGGLAMACTAYPAADGLNKPVTFFSDDTGAKWNTAAARRADLITITGYEPFAAADINGMNVLLAEDGKYRLYFNNFRDGHKTFRASSDDGKHFQFDGVVHHPSNIVNDVKRFTLPGGEQWYLMALHHNGPSLYCALSRDGRRFGEMKTLAAHGGDADRHIVSIGWVVADDNRLLGFLYGAGPAPSLDRNRIFARWLQKKVVIETDKASAGQTVALGPDRQLLPLTAAIEAKLRLHAEDGEAPIAATSDPVALRPGRAYRLEVQTPPNPSAPARAATPR